MRGNVERWPELDLVGGWSDCLLKFQILPSLMTNWFSASFAHHPEPVDRSENRILTRRVDNKERLTGETYLGWPDHTSAENFTDGEYLEIWHHRDILTCRKRAVRAKPSVFFLRIKTIDAYRDCISGPDRGVDLMRPGIRRSLRCHLPNPA